MTLVRITRVTESLYYDYFIQSTPTNSFTVIIEGMSNYQFVDDGIPPDYLNSNDITPEISDASATDQLTTLMKSFIKVVLCSQYTDCFDEKISIGDSVIESLNLIRPILDAYQIEGYYYLKNPPCFSLAELDPTNCTLGSEWVSRMQRIFGTLDIEPNITFQRFNDLLIKRPKLHCSVYFKNLIFKGN